MTRDYNFEEAFTTEESFHLILGQLLIAAERKDIDISGSYVYKNNGSNLTDWEAMIFELAKEDMPKGASD